MSRSITLDDQKIHDETAGSFIQELSPDSRNAIAANLALINTSYQSGSGFEEIRGEIFAYFFGG